jgi:hypothetical protein
MDSLCSLAAIEVRGRSLAPLKRISSCRAKASQFLQGKGYSVSARKVRIIHIEDHLVLDALPDSVFSDEGVVVLAPVTHCGGRGGRRNLVVWTGEPIPVCRHCRGIAFDVDALCGDYVVAKLRSREGRTGGRDICYKIDDRVVTQRRTSAAWSATGAIAGRCRTVTHRFQSLGRSVVVQEDVATIVGEQVSNPIGVLRVQVVRISIPKLIDRYDVFRRADTARFKWIDRPFRASSPHRTASEVQDRSHEQREKKRF